MKLQVKRIYDPPASSDGKRILVDRLWPRGVARARAHIDEWVRDVAPSDPLRKWFGHDPDRWVEFRRRYFTELRAHPDEVRTLRGLVRGTGPVTLVFSARDTEHNNAVALREYLTRH